MRSQLIWSHPRQRYELHTHGTLEKYFSAEDESAFSVWVSTQTTFAFAGKSGRVSMLKEARARGGGYWYGYRKENRKVHKAYLGPSSQVTFRRLEMLASQLASLSPTPPLALTQQALSLKLEGSMLSTKLVPPCLPPRLVERSRLLKDLEAIHTHPLTLVSASAGSGKTTLLSAWVAASDTKQSNGEMAGHTKGEPTIAWLTLDALENDPVHFWVSVITALNTPPGEYSQELGREALALLRAQEPPPLHMLLATLLNEIVRLDQSLILILDDYHVISDQTIHDGLHFLLEHQPANLHLVIATRTDSAIPLSRLRVRGKIVEIRDSDLRFTREEASIFLLKSMSLNLSQDEVTVLSRRTEGWIAGLQLAALSLHKRENPSSFLKNFEGSHRYLQDYMQQEILALLPEELQQFLLQTSIVPRLHARLCQAVAGIPTREAAQTLLELEQANLFIVPLDEQRQWYRYHDLFREALLARLHTIYPELIPHLHIRAAHFYESTGEFGEAIEHALAAQAYDLAVSLMKQAAPLFWLRGEAQMIHRWILSLPDTLLHTSIHLALEASLRFIDAIRLSPETLYVPLLAQGQQLLSRMQSLLYQKGELALAEADAILLERRLRLLAALIETRTILKHRDMERLQSLSSELDTLSPDTDVRWNMIPLTLTWWLTYQLQGQGILLVSRLLETKQQQLASGDHLGAVRVIGWLAHAYRQAGQLHRAYEVVQEALALVMQTEVRTSLVSWLYYSQFSVCYAWNRLEEAANWLSRFLQVARDWHNVELLVMGEFMNVLLSIAQGDLQTAQTSAQRQEDLLAQNPFANLTSWQVQTRVPYWLASGNMAEADKWATQTRFDQTKWEYSRVWEFLGLVQVLLVQQRYSEVIEILEHSRKYFGQPTDFTTSARVRALYVVALYQHNRSKEALQEIIHLLTLTEPEKYMRLYLDIGPLMEQVLLELLSISSAESRPLPTSYISALLEAFQQQRQARLASPQSEFSEILSSLPQPPAGVISWSNGRLSKQELKVLHRLCAGQTYAQMAQELIVSLNTIKTQVSSIYRKLGVSRRAEAIRMAQRLSLL